MQTMCSQPPTINGHTVACGHCNQCLAARKNDWIVRAMAEKATSPHTYSLELTYRNDVDGNAPDGAKVFTFRHVQEFLKRLRTDYYRAYRKRGEVRYLVVGERGSKRDRVHWHMILFTKRPLARLGSWRCPDTGKHVEPLPMQKRVLWTFWPHGHVHFGDPDQRGIGYALKYILKDQFALSKARGTMRESKAERYAASMFRMSKKPAIGTEYLEAAIASWKARAVVPTSLKLKIPGYTGYWWPKASMRERLLEGIEEANEEAIERTGRNAAQWEFLLASLVEQENDFERLSYGECLQGAEEEGEAQGEAIKRELEQRANERDKRARAQEVIKRCGGLEVCRACYASLEDAERASYRRWYHEQAQGYVTDAEAPKGQGPEQWFRARSRTNPFCRLRDAPGTLEQHFARYGTQ